MKKFTTINEIQKELKQIKQNGNSIGFVPTMGALHQGHIQLIKQAQQQAQHVVVSIFVNPTQFNDPKDFEKYPRTIQEDLQLLSINNVNSVFLPDTNEIYGEKPKIGIYDLGGLDTTMEGKYRSGHFQGVVQIVHKLFNIISPDFAFFGEKDFQQLSIIRYITTKLNIPVQIISIPTLRNPNGLALSSRNARLTTQQQQISTILYETLKFIQNNMNFYSPQSLKEVGIEKINSTGLNVEYLEFVHPLTLKPIENEWGDNIVACVAAYCGDVRLIDNLIIKGKVI